ncbi:hypothetical protein OSB04_001328 [Centaurea solstitialis]|uniref:Uncharacterized protein n=1 Tax=Centaurea solstitialis TaxID=347529 RepID=A0AA38U908_9ASTR|nr:hypothetical protein OSB04_001328 [Centaurea solstitialis]
MYELRFKVIDAAVDESTNSEKTEKMKTAMECLYWLFEPSRISELQSQVCEAVKEWRWYEKCRIYSLSINDDSREYYLEECDADIQRLQGMVNAKLITNGEPTKPARLLVKRMEMYLKRRLKNLAPHFSVLDIFDPNKWYQSKFDLENQLTMDTQETVLVSKVPMLKPNEFDMWKIRIRQYMLLTDYGMWEVVENGPGTDEEAAEGGARPPPRSDADRKRRQTEMKALSTMLLAIPNEYQHLFSSCTDAKALWTALEKRFSRTKSTKRNQKAILKQQYENFTSLKNESMTQTFDRFNKLIGELATVDVKMDKDDTRDDLEDKELEDLYNDLRIFEAEVEAKKRPIGYSHNAALLSSENPSSFNTTASYNNNTANETISNKNSCASQESTDDTVLEAFLASHVKSSLINDDLEQINADDLEEMDIKWQMAMLTLRMKRFIRRTGRNNFDVKRGDKAGFDKSKVKCYKCNEPGH